MQITKSGPFAALIKLWGQLTPVQRVVVVSFVAVSIVAVILIAMFATKTKNAVLFSNLSTEDAGAIVQKLGEDKVPYQFSADGTTIEVPEDKVYETRMKMATQGLPQGGSVGFELFDKQSFGMTEFTEKLNYQRALQGELTRTISQLAPVMSARVQIVIPQDKVFESEQEPPTASVVLKLRRGMPLGDEQVGGIVHLVASAVEGLKPENITVTDSDCNVLAEGAGGSNMGGGLLTSNQSKLKRQYESELARNLQTMLARVVGPDKAVVRVSADLSFDQKETKRESYEPAPSQGATGQGVIAQEDSNSEVYKGTVVPPAGIPGATKASPGDNYERKQTSRQYQVTKQEENIQSAPGGLKRLSVSVLVDDKVGASKIAAIKDAVSTAAGIDAQRGDQIAVQAIAFDNSSQKAMDTEMAKATKAELYMTLAKNGGAVLLLFAFLFFLRTIVRQIKVQSAAPVETPGAAGDNDSDGRSQMPTPAELIARATEQSYSGVGMDQPTSSYAPIPHPEQLPPELLASSPEDLAKLVRTWMADQ